VFSGTLTGVGSAPTPGWYKAVQKTFTFRTNEFGTSKLVLLDAASFNTFNKQTTLSSGGPEDLLRDYLGSADGWLLGRDGGKPTTFLQIAVTLNEKLRRSYRMN
jgi:hypothetical protein